MHVRWTTSEENISGKIFPIKIKLYFFLSCRISVPLVEIYMGFKPTLLEQESKFLPNAQYKHKCWYLYCVMCFDHQKLSYTHPLFSTNFDFDNKKIYSIHVLITKSNLLFTICVQKNVHANIHYYIFKMLYFFKVGDIN